MKQQEKFERMEQLRMEKEIRAQQILEVIIFLFKWCVFSYLMLTF